MRTLLCLLALWATCGCSLRGAKTYAFKQPLEAIVSFKVPLDCSISVAPRDRLRAQDIDLIDTGARFELVIQNSIGKGYRLTDYNYGNDQHEFTVVGRENIWTFSFPDRAGEAGIVRDYVRSSGSTEPSPANLKEYCSLDVLTYFPEARTPEVP